MSDAPETPVADATDTLSAMEQEFRTWPSIDPEISIRLYAVYGIDYVQHVFEGRALEVLRLPLEEQKRICYRLDFAYMFHRADFTQRALDAGSRVNSACSQFIKEAAEAAPREALRHGPSFESMRRADERRKKDQLIWPEAYRILALPAAEGRAELLRLQTSDPDLYDQILRAFQIHARWKNNQQIVEAVTATMSDETQPA